MNDLKKGIDILSSYTSLSHVAPFQFEHDEIYVHIAPATVRTEYLTELQDFGFIVDSENEYFIYR